MAANEYVFLTVWNLPAPPAHVFAIIDSPTEYPRWWPEVWLSVTEIDPGDDRKIGSRYDLHTRGRLPYTLRWQSCTMAKDPPRRLELTATGDFVGRGVWTLTPEGAGTRVEYDWRLTAEKPLLRRLSWLLKPFFSWNHHWAMARGYEGLCRELAARASV